MKVIVAYDIVRNKRSGRMHKFLRELGINTQKSVFECELKRDELLALRSFARNHLNLQEDCLNIYHLCRQCASKAEVQGLGIQVAQLDYHII